MAKSPKPKLDLSDSFNRFAQDKPEPMPEHKAEPEAKAKGEAPVLSFRLPEAEKAKLDNMATNTGLSRSELIALALSKLFDANPDLLSEPKPKPKPKL